MMDLSEEMTQLRSIIASKAEDSKLLRDTLIKVQANEKHLHAILVKLEGKVDMLGACDAETGPRVALVEDVDRVHKGSSGKLQDEVRQLRLESERLSCHLGATVSPLRSPRSPRRAESMVELSPLAMQFLESKLAPPFRRLEALFRGASADPKSFHRACDGRGPTVTLLKTSRGSVFGGYTPVPWMAGGGVTGFAPDSTKTSFLFILRSPRVSHPVRLALDNWEKGTGHHADFGPYFGDADLWTKGDEGGSHFPSAYSGQIAGRSCFDGSEDGRFHLSEVEVWLVADH